MTGSPFIRISNVTRRFGDVVAVDDLSLNIDKGELFCLLGASGCGKTTLLRMLAGFESVDSGSIEIDGIDMSRVPPAARPVNIMFQNGGILSLLWDCERQPSHFAFFLSNCFAFNSLSV